MSVRRNVWFVKCVVEWARVMRRSTCFGKVLWSMKCCIVEYLTLNTNGTADFALGTIRMRNTFIKSGFQSYLF